MMNEHSIGFAGGFILAVIAVIAIKRIMYGKSDRKPEYDEMQKAAQGMAYKYERRMLLCGKLFLQQL